MPATTSVKPAEPSTSLASTASVMVVDDQPVFREGLPHLLPENSGFQITSEADGLAEAMQRFHEQPTDLVMTEISLNDGNGLELTQELVALDPDIRILICSSYDDALYSERALRAGAKGYVNKRERTERILQALNRVSEGLIFLNEEMTERMLCRTVGQGEQFSQSPIESLSDRELQVFELIGRGKTTREIASQLYLSPKTIESYRENIKVKLNIQNATELTQHAVRWVVEVD